MHCHFLIFPGSLPRPAVARREITRTLRLLLTKAVKPEAATDQNPGGPKRRHGGQVN